LKALYKIPAVLIKVFNKDPQHLFIKKGCIKNAPFDFFDLYNLIEPFGFCQKTQSIQIITI